MDLSKLSDADLQALHAQASNKAINQNESSGASDSSTVVNPKSGARGNMQVMPATGGDPGFGVRPSDGSPEDTARMGRDYRAAMQNRYGDDTTGAAAYNWGPGNMDKWLAAGGDMSKIPDETLKYMHRYNQQMGKSGDSAPSAQSDAGIDDSPLSKMSDDDLKAAYAASIKPNAQQRAQDFLQGSRDQATNAVNSFQGLGEAQASMMTSMFGQGAGLLHGASELAQGNGWDAAKQAYNGEIAPVTYQPRTPEGQAINAKLGQGFNDYIEQPLEQGAQAVLPAIPFIGEDLAKSPAAQEAAKTAADVVANIGPMILGAGMHGAEGAAKGRLPSEAELAARQLAGLHGPEEPVGPATPPVDSTMGPNAGPARPPISVDSAGNARDPLQPETMEQTGAEIGRSRQQAAEQQAAGDLFPSTLADTTGHAEAYDPNRVSEDVQSPIQDHSVDPAQGVLPLENEWHAREALQGDLFDQIDQRSFDQHGGDRVPETLDRDHFEQTMESLASQEGTRIELPEDPETRGLLMDSMYDKYLDTVSDKQGGLFDRPTIADNFAKAINDSHVQRMVDDHVVVKAAKRKVDDLTQQLANATDGNAKNRIGRLLDAAKETLNKAQANIQKYFQDATPRTTAKDGVVEMNSGIKPPAWLLDGIGKMLKAFHGVVFKMANKFMKGPKDLDSFAKIVQKGMAREINEQANRKWEVKQDGNAVDKLQSKDSPLGKFEAIREWMPEDRPLEELKADPNVANAPDMDSGWLVKNWASQGGQWASAISKNPYVRWAYTKLDGAVKATEYQTKKLLTDKSTGLQAKYRAMSDADKGTLWALMDANEGKKVFTEGELRRQGFNDKQIDAYKAHQDTMKTILDQVNATRERLNMDKIDPRIAYMVSRFTGDFRSLVYQKGTGKIVGFVGHNFREGVNGIIKHIEEQNPGKYDFEKPTLNHVDKYNPQNMFQGYMNALDLLSKTDSDVKAIVDSYRDYLGKDAAKMLNALNHAKEKDGIFGAEGKKAWESQKKNANEGMKSQLKYAENMIKWSNMQEAAAHIGDFMKDPDINKPNAKNYVQDYMDNALGHTKSGMADAANSMMNAVAKSTGVGPSVWRGINNGQKSALLQLWLGFARIPHSIITLTQFLQSNPAFAQMVKSRGIDASFWGSSLKGMSTVHKMMMERFGKEPNYTPVEKAIKDYNDKNGVFNVNLKSHLEDINQSNVKRNWNWVTEANILYPELAIRSATFSTWVHALHDSGMPLHQALGTAENFTRGALVDYRPTERPLVYGKMGFLGDIASTLTRFKQNQVSQHVYFGKNALSQGDIKPLMALMGTAIVFGGVTGLLGFNIANQAYNTFTKYALGKPDSLKAMALRNLPDWAHYGVMAQMGVNMQGSFSNADTIPDNPLGALFPTGGSLAAMASSVAELARNRDMATAKKVMYNFSPTSLKGIEENTMFSKNNPNGTKDFYNPQNQKLEATRSPADQVKRDFAFHPIAEARNRDVAYEAKDLQQDNTDLRNHTLLKASDILSQRKLTQQEASDLSKEYAAHRGDPNSFGPDLVKFMEDRHMNPVQRSIGMDPNSLSAMYNVNTIRELQQKGKK